MKRITTPPVLCHGCKQVSRFQITESEMGQRFAFRTCKRLIPRQSAEGAYECGMTVRLENLGDGRWGARDEVRPPDPAPGTYFVEPSDEHKGRYALRMEGDNGSEHVRGNAAGRLVHTFADCLSLEQAGFMASACNSHKAFVAAAKKTVTSEWASRSRAEGVRELSAALLLAGEEVDNG